MADDEVRWVSLNAGNPSLRKPRLTYPLPLPCSKALYLHCTSNDTGTGIGMGLDGICWTFGYGWGKRSVPAVSPRCDPRFLPKATKKCLTLASHRIAKQPAISSFRLRIRHGHQIMIIEAMSVIVNVSSLSLFSLSLSLSPPCFRFRFVREEAAIIIGN